VTAAESGTAPRPWGKLERLGRAVGRNVLRARYLFIAAAGGLLAAHMIAVRGHGITDWLLFESGARSLIHFHHIQAYGGHALDLYVRLPGLQIGPPAILPVAAFQWLPPWTVNKLFVGVIVALGVAGVRAAELAARTIRGRGLADALSPAVLVGGLIVATDWAWCAVHWHHLDDALALSLTAIACWLIARGRPWWLIGLLIGTAVAAKPWAIMLTPVFLGLPREQRSKAVLAAVASAAAWWGPFVIGGPGTITALGGFHVDALNGSVLSLLGIHGEVQHWLRPVQFLAGIAVGLLVARRGELLWLAAPLAALAVRVLTDPYSWGYYGSGPILFALMWDLARPSARRIPIYTLLTAAVEGLVPRFVRFDLVGPASTSADLAASLKLAWGAGILIALFLEVRRHAARRAITV
jgi:hypothetical protein